MMPSTTVAENLRPARRAEPAVRRVLMTLDAVGGVGRYAVDLARALGASGVQTLLVGFGPRPAPHFAAECLGLPHAELMWMDQALDWMAADDDACDAQVAALSALVRTWKPELLHLNSPALAAGIESRLPVVAAMHSCTATWWDAVKGTELPPDWVWQRERNRRGLARAARVMVPSEAYGAAVRKIYGPLETLRVVANGSACPIADNAGDPFVIAAARWWDEGKNGAVLDAAAATTAWPVFMAGALEGPDGQSIAIAHAHAMGSLPAAALRETMRRAAIFVAPSRFEPFGLSVLEAARCGAALVLADIPTFRRMWTGAAVFVAPDDAVGFAAAINRLAGDAGLRRRLSRRAVAIARAYTPARQARETLDVYAEALATHRREVH